MANFFQKLPGYWAYFSRSEKIWRLPVKSEVLIYGLGNRDYLLYYLEKYDAEILAMRGEQINVWVALLSLFEPGPRRQAYVDKYIAMVGPRLIITFLDNNYEFYSISRRHPQVKTMFLQNGRRGFDIDVFGRLSEAADKNRDALKVDYMMTFGSNVANEYSRYIEGRAIAMGSLKCNMVPRSKSTVPGVIAYVSQFRDIKGQLVKGNYRTHEEIFGQVEKSIVPFLFSYARSHEKQLVIITSVRSKNSNIISKEQQHYNELVGAELSYTDEENCYDAADAAEVVVAVDSTVGVESIGRGNKTAIFSIRGTLLDIKGQDFGWPRSYPAEGPFWTNNPDSSSYERILDHLFELNDEAWQKELSEYSSEAQMLFDPGNTIFLETLEAELGHNKAIKESAEVTLPKKEFHSVQ